MLKADGGEGTAPIVQCLRRQDHHLSPAVGINVEKIEGFLGKRGQAMDGKCTAAGGDFPATVSTPKWRK